MLIRTVILLFILSATITLSCKKDDNPPVPETGLYRGVFSRIINGTDTSGTGVLFLAIKEDYSSFSMNGDTSSNAPLSNSGKYELIDFNLISFTNTVPLAALEDRFFILDTVYSYEYSDSSFIMNLTFDTVVYNYNLSPF